MTCDDDLGSTRRPVIAGLAALLIAATGAATAAQAAPSHLESIEGSDLKRVILEAKAAERLAIQTEPIREEKVVFRTMVLGEVEDEPAKPAAAAPELSGAPTSGTAPKPAPSPEGKIRVLVLLDIDPDDDIDDDVGDIDDDDDEHSAEIMAPDDDDEEEPLWAKRVVMASGAEGEPNTLYFKVRGGTRHNLTPGQRVGVRLAAPGSGAAKKVIPYSAVLYDVSGDAWVYTNPEPLAFVRHRVTIDTIDRGVATLRDGPAVGTKVVTVGAAELLGAESGVGH